MINYSNDNISKYNEEDSIFNSEIYKLVDGNIYPIFPFEKINYSLETYIINNKIRIDYLEFEKLKASQFILDDYIKLEKAKNLLEKRLFCINNFKYICVDNFEPPICTISKYYLEYIYDNINIFFNILKLDAEYCVILVLRYGVLNINTNKRIINKLHKDIEQLHTYNINEAELEKKKIEIEDLIILLQNTSLYGKELTLNECGEIYGVTRERIRQKASVAERKLLNSLNNVISGNYDEIFLFNFNKRSFNDVFYISDFIINNRNSFCKELNYNNSLFTPFDFFEIYSGLYDEVATLYYIQNNYINVNSTWILINKYELFRYWISQMLVQPMSLEDIYEEFIMFLDKYIPENRKDRYKELKSYAALLERQDNIIKSNKHYRLRSVENSATFLEELSIIVDTMPGFFSTKKIFDENNSLMNKFNIIDQYELHYFIRQNIDYFSKKIKMERMPHISKGYEFEKYLINNIEKTDYSRLDEFLEKFSKKTGILPQTVLGNQSNTIERYYLNNMRLKQNHITPPNGYMQSKYTLDMYSEEEYIDDLNLYGYQNFLNNGFRVVWDLLIRSNNIKGCILSQFDEFGLTTFSNVSNSAKASDAFYVTLYNLRQNLEIVKIEEFLYLKVSEELRYEIKSLLNILHCSLLENNYLTLGELMLLANNEKFILINGYQFDEIFFREILFSEKSIKLLHNIIYYEGDSNLRILDNIIKENQKVSIWDIEYYLENERSWLYNQNFIDRIKTSSDYYYVKEIDSVFCSKKAFIKYLEEN